MAEFSDYVVTDGSSTWVFAPISEEGSSARQILIGNRPWEPHDPKQPFRIPLFPWNGGLGRDRLRNTPTYAKADADTTVPGLLLHPPLLVSKTLTDITGTVRAVGEYSSTKVFLGGDDTDTYYFNPSNNTVTKVACGNNVKGFARFDGELIAWHGDGTIIRRFTGAAWNQGADAVHADAMGVVDNLLWRAEGNLISNCDADPEDIDNWVPGSGSEYECGDGSYSVHTIIDFQGTVWCGRPDGMYSADPLYEFHNQTPQLLQRPHADNCKGAFVAHGALWVPSSSGLYRVRWGECLQYGPELAHRPDYRFWTRAGLEFGGDIYLLCTDENGSEDTVIIKMVRDKMDPDKYSYHEWCRLGNTTGGYALAVTTGGTNPKLIIPHGTNMEYIDLGRGGGNGVDDSNYNYGTSGELETGPIRPASDLTLLSMLQGVEVLLDYSADGESLTLSAKTDGGSYANLLDTQEGGGSAAISSTTNFENKIRYAGIGTQVGHFHEIKFASTLTSASGTNRPEVREAWAFGWIRPKMTDYVTLTINASEGAWIGEGKQTGITTEEIVRLFRYWAANNTILTWTLDEYDEGKTTRFLVTDVQIGEKSLDLGYGINKTVAKTVVVTLVRLVFGDDYATAA